MTYRLCPTCDQIHPRDTRCPLQRPRRHRTKAAQHARANQLARTPYCEECGTTRDLTVDHRTPLARGGTDDPANLATLCRSCNSSKGTHTPENTVESRMKSRPRDTPMPGAPTHQETPR